MTAYEHYRKMAYAADMSDAARREAVADAAAYLSTVAEQLDKWAEESRTGGWSTHQVAGNTALADSCRRMADRLRRLQ